MTIKLFCQGFAVGVLAAIPLGPMGMLCVQRTLTYGRRSGLVSASGLAVAAALWCLIAVKSLGLVADKLSLESNVFKLGLGLFLVAAAVGGWARGHRPKNLRIGKGGMVGQFLSSLVVVMTNPITLVTLTAVLAVLGVVRVDLGVRGGLALMAAVFFGGMTLWVVVAQLLNLLRHRLGPAGCARINWSLNLVIFLMGVGYLLASVPWSSFEPWLA